MEEMKIKKYLGVDWGEKRIGLALGDSENKIATPFKVVESLSVLVEVIEKEKIDVIVLGLPKKMNGNQDLNPKFTSFFKLLKAKVKAEIVLFDERLTSVQADTLKVKKIKQERDAISAMLILQNYFDC